MSRDRIVLLHGINTAGEWQDQARESLEPHFECVVVKYRYYRYLGATAVIVEPWLGLVAVLLLVLSVSPLVGLGTRAALILSAIAAIAAAIAARFVRRAWALRICKRHIDGVFNSSTEVPGRRIHVIAHSFGTYITGTILRRFPDARIAKVILVGCILPSSFDWRRILQTNPFAFKHVRNEMGKSDWVVRLSGIAGRVLSDIGAAGLEGFSGPEVHTLETPYAVCAQCGRGKAIVHNIPFDFFGHSDAFISGGHAVRFWLPELFGISAFEHAALLELCQCAADAEDDQDWKTVALAELELSERVWHWARDRTLHEFLRDLVGEWSGSKQLGLRPSHRVERAVRLFWRAVASAERSRLSKKSDPRLVLALNPYVAAARAVDAAQYKG